MSYISETMHNTITVEKTLLISLKSEINLMVPFILGIIKVGTANGELLNFFNTPILIIPSTSFLRV